MINELEYEDYKELDYDFIENEVLGDVDPANLEETIKYDAENFVSYFESDNDFELKPIDEDTESSSDETSQNNQETLENELKIKNLSINLGLWLKECIDEGFTGHFLSYKNFKIAKDLTSINEIISNFNKNEESSIDAIISNFELEDVLEYRYNHYFNDREFKNTLMELFLPMGVIILVDIAKKYNATISLTKEGLIKNFLEVFSPYQLIKVLNDEGLDIIRFLDIPVLEQIYMLNDSQLENISKEKCTGEKFDLMSCVIKQYDREFLISHDKL